MMRIALFWLLLFFAFVSPELRADEGPDRDDRMEWWREARFGMFVHWGLYSGLAGTWEGKPVATQGGMEWIQQRVKADTKTYADRAVPLFKPTPDFARQWAQLAKQAGCKYVVFTTKHHDGFALHDSKVSGFDAGSVLNRDLVKEIVEACRAEGLRIGFYHSVIDWHHDQYEYQRSEQLPHPLKGKPYPNKARNHDKYVEFLHAQVDELISNYGPIDILWWDYSAVDFQGDKAWQAFKMMDAVRAKHPQIIMNNRLFRTPESGHSGMQMTDVAPQLDNRYGDFLTPEQHVPAAGFPGVDWESCMTMNTTWGYSKHDDAWKSDQELIRTLIDVASKGGNLLLNIGPYADGTVPEESVQGMQAIGGWMKANSASIYGTTASPFAKFDWGRCTVRETDDGNTRLFFHIFDWPIDQRLTLPGITAEPIKAWILESNVALKTELAAGDGGLVVRLPASAVNEIATVVVVELEGKFSAPHIEEGK